MMKTMAAMTFLTAVFVAGAAFGLNTVEITEWPVPWEDTRPRDPYVDSKNRVWFVGQKGDYLAFLDPKSGNFNRVELEPGTGPHNLVVDGKDRVWYAGNLKAHIGRLDPATGEISRFPLTHPEVRDPHTLALDDKGDIWFTAQGGNFVGKLSADSGKIHVIPVPSAGGRPYGIIVDRRNRPWIAEFGTHKLATVDPKTMALKEIALPREDARPRRLAETTDGRIWYVDFARGYLGNLDPATGNIREWPVPGGVSARPYALAVDDRDRLWFVECGPQPNRLVGFDPTQARFISISAIGSGGGTVRHMYFHKPSREIWFGTDKNTIGRASIP